MNDVQINYLKQFIAVTVPQATAGMATKDDMTILSNIIVDLGLKSDTISENLSYRRNHQEIRHSKLEH